MSIKSIITLTRSEASDLLIDHALGKFRITETQIESMSNKELGNFLDQFYAFNSFLVEDSSHEKQ